MGIIVLQTKAQPLPDKLIGKWHLHKIVNGQQTLKPEKVDYWLSIAKTSIKYNYPINRCHSEQVTYQNDTLKIKDISITKICCDDRVDTFYKYLNYEGKTQFLGDTLVIENKQGRYYMTK